MPSVINSDDGVSSGTAGLKTSGSNDGITVFQQNGTESARITAAGNVGIGTSSPTQELHLYKDQNAATEILIENPNTGTSGRALLELSPELGFAYFTANSSTSTVSAIAGGALGAGLYTSSGLSNGLSVGTTAGALKFFAGSTSAERARIDSSGNLLVGKTTTSTNSGPGVILYGQSTISGYGRIDFVKTSSGTFTASEFNHSTGAVGSITYSNTATAYNTSSDYRLKHDIAPMTGALAKVSALKPVTYKWNVDGSAGEGFIAHELAEVCPQAVVGKKDAVDAEGTPQYQGIDTSFLVATLTAAIQELKAELDATKAEVAALKARTT